MSTTTTTPTGARRVSRAPRIVSLLCFALLGGLTARRGDGASAAAAALVSFLTGWPALALMGWLLAASSKAIDRKEARGAVSRGFLLLVPFTILALVAGLGLGWDSAAAFASAGIMTASTAVGVELQGAGGRRGSSVLLPMLLGTALSAGWIACTSVAVHRLVEAVQRILAAAPGGSGL